MATVFLSYSRDDQTRVSQLASALERGGHTVWWDRDIAPGQEFAGAIEKALDAADVVVVAWSATAVHSVWVRDEAAAGRDTARLVPVTIDGCPPPLGFRQLQTIDLAAWNGRPRSPVLAPLVEAIATKVSAGTPPASPQSTPQPRSRFAFGRGAFAALAAAAALLLAAGPLVYGRLQGGEPRTPGEVVLGDFEIVSAGLRTDLATVLKQEMLAAFGAETAVTVVAERARARSTPFLLEGSIAGAQGAARFTVNLMNRKTGVLLWSGAFNQESLDGVAARQTAVNASQVVRCGLWGAANYPGRMPDEALSLYLQWCNAHWRGSSSLEGELDAARRVTVAVPDFSFGWSARALAAAPLSQDSASADPAELRREAIEAARRSIALDGHNPEGYMALASLLPRERYAEREALLRKAISVRPTECGCERQAYGDFLASVGRMEEAADEYERARAMRPLAPFSNLRFAQALYVVGRHEEADRVLAGTLELWPDATSLQLLRMKSALWTRRYEEAIALLAKADLPLTSVQRAALQSAFEALKSRDSARRAEAAARLERFSADPRRNDRIVVATLAALGAPDAALRAAASLVRTRGMLETEVLFEPNLAAARSEPGYARLIHSLGLVSYWRSGQRPPDICRDSDRPQFCAVA
ncbi:MAG TPA: toll/interleukin-1 receptor domain-containing protein [Sphingomicrobium sp.]|nr:toll/interleukin-1 receptor domain-containing protein [Sphingomicrobium sp.]